MTNLELFLGFGLVGAAVWAGVSADMLARRDATIRELRHQLSEFLDNAPPRDERGRFRKRRPF
jgi:hypothetical protein